MGGERGELEDLGAIEGKNGIVALDLLQNEILELSAARRHRSHNTLIILYIKINIL